MKFYHPSKSSNSCKIWRMKFLFESFQHLYLLAQPSSWFTVSHGFVYLNASSVSRIQHRRASIHHPPHFRDNWFKSCVFHLGHWCPVCPSWISALRVCLDIQLSKYSLLKTSLSLVFSNLTPWVYQPGLRLSMPPSLSQLSLGSSLLSDECVLLPLT